jgi:hypothetical protein
MSNKSKELAESEFRVLVWVEIQWNAGHRQVRGGLQSSHVIVVRER